MSDTPANTGDEVEDPVIHLQEVVDEADLDSSTAEYPLTLDPSTSSTTPSLRTHSLKTRPDSSSRPLPLRSPRNLFPGLLVRLDAQTLLRRRCPTQPQSEPILAVGRSAAAFAHHTFLQVGQNYQDEGLFGFSVR